MSCVGIDFDTHAVHLVKLEEDGTAIYLHAPLEGADAFERVRAVRGAMPSHSAWDDVVAVAIEEPQGTHKATVAKLKAVQGAIVACIPRATLVEPMVPARWRKAVGLHGHDTKTRVWGFTAAKLGVGSIADWPQDACDSYCLALAVSTLWEKAA